MKQTAIYQRKRPQHSHLFNKWIQSPRWFAGFGIACLVALVVYALNMLLSELHPGNTWGLSYGIAAAVLFAGVMLYSARRRMMGIRALPRSWHYLQFHVYGGTLFLLLVFMHSNFSTPNGIVTWWLWILSIWIVLSGLFGIVLQKWIPTVLNAGLSIEVHYDRIPDLIDASRERAETIAGSGSEVIQEFYRKELAPAFNVPKHRWMYYIDAASSIHANTKKFEHIRQYLSSEEQSLFDELNLVYKSKLEMDAHYTLQRALRWWIYAHAPLSVLLFVFLVVHIFSVYYY